MGAAKHEMMRYQDERWSEIDDDRSACKECFNDEGIKKFITLNSSGIGCDFCDDGEKRKSLDLNSVIEFVADCINREYADPQGVLPWDSEDGCYLLESEIISTEFLIGDFPAVIS